MNFAEMSKWVCQECERLNSHEMARNNQNEVMDVEGEEAEDYIIEESISKSDDSQGFSSDLNPDSPVREKTVENQKK